MLPCPSVSAADIVDALIYSHVKRLNPKMLTEIFPKQRCKVLEKNYANIDSGLLKTILKNYRIQKKFTQALKVKQDGEEDSWKTDMMHERFCNLKDAKKSVHLALYHHFRSKMDFNVLKELFDENTRKNFEKLMEKIDVPSLQRMLASYRIGKLRNLNSTYLMIFKCRLCKKELRGLQVTFKQHIGQHEDIPSYCFIQGCNMYFKTYNSLRGHLNRKHDLRDADLNSTQYLQLQTALEDYYSKAATFMDRYFPPESFVRFNDRQMSSTHKMEDTNCLKCGVRILTPLARRSHVAEHLGLPRPKCVVGGCDASFAGVHNMTAHLKNHHKIKMKDLAEEELYALKKLKIQMNKLMKEEVPKYFPIKVVKNEESD
ncbi:hypothetical protein L596_009342 [Steinernema carpocapsae]|uniref:C2H2-type domain-containing protein n=1 Tax=Steinernema carpocapsae TaxID=34508 RepID=A0A4U5PGD3_STECR|nr:hypothetical protein L596_009342 [Steinernema carpocapsae]